MAKVYDVRGYLGSIGVTTPVSTVHTWVFIRDNPSMCGADFVGANAQYESSSLHAARVLILPSLTTALSMILQAHLPQLATLSQTLWSLHSKAHAQASQ
jgi:hypothetical protein